MSLAPTLELAARNLSWMSGNLFLAWSAVLFALHLRGTPRQQRAAAVALVVAAPVLLAGRLAARGTVFDHPVRSIVLVAVVGIAALAWSMYARHGNRPARAIGYLGVLVFAPNAPYILTDLFHHLQDVRLAQLGLGASVVFALQYGWFLVFGAASWVALLDLCRDWLRRHRPATNPLAAFVVVCGIMAFGIYLGRIERFHSWHPLAEPGRFAARVANAMTSPGPIGFTLVWWVVVLVAGVVGLRLLDRSRRGEGSVGALLVALSWAASGALLAGTPVVAHAYRLVGVEVGAASRGVAVACVVLGVLLCTYAGTRLARLLAVAAHERESRPRLLAWSAVAAIALPILGAALTIASAAQWYTQFRGLCEYGPNPELHGDSCRD